MLNTTQLGLNEIYKEMFSKRKQLNEVTSLKNLIHSEVESIRSQFTENISTDGLEEKLRDAEKNDLTPKDKEIIKHIRKVIETIDALLKVEFEGVINTKDANVEGETKEGEEKPPEGGSSEEQLKAAEVGGETAEPPADEFTFGG
jgi:hypothetical protein